jgi:general secretion pathway protein G
MTTPSHHSRRQAGFTLIELIVTISILTVLAGILIPSVNSYLDKGNTSKAHADLREIANVFNRYKVDTGFWPTNDDKTTIKTANEEFTGYAGLFTDTASRNGWDGPYLNTGVMVDGAMNVATYDSDAGTGEGMLDPWGHAYRVYFYADGTNDTAGAIVLASAGKDGKYNSSKDDIFEARASEDDVLQLVTYNVN